MGVTLQITPNPREHISDPKTVVDTKACISSALHLLTAVPNPPKSSQNKNGIEAASSRGRLGDRICSETGSGDTVENVGGRVTQHPSDRELENHEIKRSEFRNMHIINERREKTERRERENRE